jgi:hypothetical protein
MKGLEAMRRAVRREEAAVIEWLLRHGEQGSDRFFCTGRDAHDRVEVHLRLSDRAL